jgi:hypothetical protein
MPVVSRANQVFGPCKSRNVQKKGKCKENLGFFLENLSSHLVKYHHTLYLRTPYRKNYKKSNATSFYNSGL